jgi:hypothetical protein
MGFSFLEARTELFRLEHAQAAPEPTTAREPSTRGSSRPEPPTGGSCMSAYRITLANRRLFQRTIQMRVENRADGPNENPES